jgi:triacylglycerol lipase
MSINPCRTKYPILLIHGIGSQDSLLGIEYFGRIPSFLAKNCEVKIFQGGQDAFGTIELNAVKLIDTILNITDHNGYGKVNIIAHSKGGLDTRYMLHLTETTPFNGKTMLSRIASFSTLATPHRGTVLADYLFEVLTPGAEAVIEPILTAFGRLQGDSSHADAKASLLQLRNFEIAKLNKEMGDLETGFPGLYAQSWATQITGAISDPIFKAASMVMNQLDAGPNDGVVEVASAKYGHFRGTLGSGFFGGVSHMAIVDRAQVVTPGITPGFDPRAFFKSILVDLKAKGF